ncbi:MAG: aminotransferase class V-fold PLP-dependent enzyme, partial [Actinomycetota bacterium]|nr:aminotransferase class V-fold PLP-dependent enzyme [Actinomycetota bacterium]
VNAEDPDEIVFVRNTTEALNLVAVCWGRANLKPGDVILATMLEHHSNLIPWQRVAQETGARIRLIQLTPDGTVDMDNFRELLGPRTRVVAIAHASNVLGTISDLGEISAMAHRAGAIVVVDGAQSVPHLATDVTDLGCDFLAFSSHKMCGPTGIGVLWAAEDLLDSMPAFLGGGEMIRDVRLDSWLPNDIPWKFEAGTPPIAEAIGLGAAIDYLDGLGMPAVREHEVALTHYALTSLRDRHGSDIEIFGPSDAADRGGVISFNYKGIHPHDVSQVLDQAGICVRAGHHCAKPLMRRLGVGATARASFYVYNSPSDVDALSESLAAASDLFLPA